MKLQKINCMCQNLVKQEKWVDVLIVYKLLKNLLITVIMNFPVD
jgi:hypothetical protein